MATKTEQPRTTQRDETIRAFKEHVNLTARQLERWLQSETSQSVGRRKPGASESTGHASGRRIVELLRKKKADYDDGDLAHMRKVVGYIKRHAR